jgi:hypothetical protein
MARVGKIARLPAELREEVCRRLHDGQTAAAVLGWLHAQPAAVDMLARDFGGEPVSPQNLSEWRAGGFQDWLANRERVDRIRALADAAHSVAAAGDMQLSEGAAAIAGGKLLEALESADPEQLDQLVLAVARLRQGDARRRAIGLAQRRTDQRERELALDEARFRRQTAELFLEWYADRRAKEIADAPTDREGKMQALIGLMFGAPPPPPPATEASDGPPAGA